MNGTYDPVFSEFFHEYIKPDPGTEQRHPDGEHVTISGDGQTTGNRYVMVFFNGTYEDVHTIRIH